MSRKKLNILIAVILVLFGYFYDHFSNSAENRNAPVLNTAVSATPQITPSVIGTSSASFKVIKVIDGDTIQIDSGAKIRYIGIDTPETVDPRRGVGCFGREASEKNKELVLGKQVFLEKDLSDTDRFGRLLRYVYIENVSTVSGTALTFVNDHLVKTGYAKASSYPPDVKYQEKFLESEKFARDNSLGLWSVCK